MSGSCTHEAGSQRERRLLWIVLLLNASMFVIEFTAGWIAHSSGLIADSLDMLADSVVYAISLYAVGRSLALKARAAMTNGVLQFCLSILVLLDVVRRLLLDTKPDSDMMTLISLLAFAVNISSFMLLYSFRRGDINLRASWICSRNDMLANAGVFVAAILVSVSGQSWPDLLVGTLIAAFVMHSAAGIIREASESLRNGTAAPDCSHDHG